ncbi:hypothetical protein [Methanoculleus chikugoensis]|uniref:hypothetical protein n=1 Tax=Methanoculleus chikugoensis TaxID=118126 RepID=UPI001FB4DE0C|nr:hypothetical protein [Methanoculleus chikugoensis]
MRRPLDGYRRGGFPRGGRITMHAAWIVLGGIVALLITGGGCGEPARRRDPPTLLVGRRYRRGLHPPPDGLGREPPSTIDGLAVSFNATYLPPGMRPDFADIRFIAANGTALPPLLDRERDRRLPRPRPARPPGERDGGHDALRQSGGPGRRRPPRRGLPLLRGLRARRPLAVVVLRFERPRSVRRRPQRRICRGISTSPDRISRSSTTEGSVPRISPRARSSSRGDFRVSEFGRWCGSGYIQAWNGTNRLYALHLRNGSVQHYDGDHRNFSADKRVENNIWYRIRVVLDTPNATEHAWMDGEYLGSAPPLRFADGSPVPEDAIFDEFALIGSSAWYSGNPHHFYVDNVVVRKYVPVEPVLSYGGDGS